MIATFTRLDLSSWFPRSQILLTLLFVVGSGLFLPVPGLAIIAAALVTSLMVSAPFLGDERGHLDTLYGVLPISRGTVVVGRALSVFTYYVVASVLATATTFVTELARGGSVDAGILLIAHAVAFAFVGISVAFQLPVLFRIGYSRGRLMAYAPAFLVAGLAWLVQALDATEPIQRSLEGIPVLAFGAAGMVIGIAGIVFAVAVSARFYRTREL